MTHTRETKANQSILKDTDINDFKYNQEKNCRDACVKELKRKYDNNDFKKKTLTKEQKFQNKWSLGAVAEVCNLNYLGDGELRFKDSLGKKFRRFIFSSDWE
jgi:hypothetical protein